MIFSVRSAAAVFAAALLFSGCATNAGPGRTGELPGPREERAESPRDGSAPEAAAAESGTTGEKTAPAVPPRETAAASERPAEPTAVPANPPATAPQPAPQARPATVPQAPAAAPPQAPPAPPPGAAAVPKTPQTAPPQGRQPAADPAPASPRYRSGPPAAAAPKTPQAAAKTEPRTPAAVPAPPATAPQASAAAAKTEPQASPAAAVTAPSPAGEKTAAVSAEIGRPIEISLTGIGWIYLGDEGGTGAIRYQGKETVDGTTVFSFLAFQTGDYRLKFQQQDIPANTIRHEDVRIAVAQGKTAEAKPESVPSAAKAAEAQAAVSADAPRAAAPTLSPGADTAAPAAAEPAEDRYRRLVAENRVKEAAADIEAHLRAKNGAVDDPDAWYFRLAELYDRDPEMKNMKKALYYYERIRDLYPMSPFWHAADARSRYIRVNFIEIR